MSRRAGRDRVARGMARLGWFAKDVTGRSGPALVALLVEHLSTDLEAVRLAQRFVKGLAPAEAAEEEIRRVEHRGDELRQRLVADLSRMIVTPLDREDLFRLSRSIDDVLDNTRDFVREWHLYRPDDGRNLAGVLDTLASGIEEFRRAVDAVATRAEEVPEHLLAAKRAAGRVRRQFQVEVARLLAGEVTAEVLKHRELLRRLDVVGLRFGEAVDVLFDALVKRGGAWWMPEPEP
jgi:hypothetical protein